MTFTAPPGSRSVDVFSSPETLARAAAARFVESAASAIAAHGRFVVALSGGSTPRACFDLLATPEFSAHVDWSNVHIAWGDERCVPPNDAQSNFRMASDALLSHVPIRAQNVHRMFGELEPAEAALQYEHTLRALFSTSTGAPQHIAGARFDLVLLGLGTDGHTASLFPRGRSVRETERWVTAEFGTSVNMWRLTLTPPIINAAARVLFLVAGADKAAVLQRVWHDAINVDLLPAQAVRPSHGELHWMVNQGAVGGRT